ncbi:MAG: phage scaffolding protein [Oscillospiraceae bacterium]|nr:phage scaffolding protein [Oscillospiraceae bacterium]
MRKEDFIALGISEELAKKCADASAEELKGFIPKTRFDEVNTERKNLETAVSDSACIHGGYKMPIGNERESNQKHRRATLLPKSFEVQPPIGGE